MGNCCCYFCCIDPCLNRIGRAFCPGNDVYITNYNTQPPPIIYKQQVVDAYPLDFPYDTE